MESRPWLHRQELPDRITAIAEVERGATSRPRWGDLLTAGGSSLKLQVPEILDSPLVLSTIQSFSYRKARGSAHFEIVADLPC